MKPDKEMFFDIPKNKPDRVQLSDYNWVKNQSIHLNKEDLDEIKAKFKRKQIYVFIYNLIYDHQLMFPFKKFSPSECKSLFSKLKHNHYPPIEKVWSSEKCNGFSFDYKGSNLVLSSSVGTKVSDMFTHKERLKAQNQRRSGKYEGIFGVWEHMRNDKFEDKHYDRPTYNFLGAFVFLNDKLNEDAVYTAGRLGGGSVSQFKPSVAKGIYEFFGAKRILDFCSGWGDRLVGFLASNAESYVGIDPNTKLHEPYQQIEKFCNTGKPTQFICSPAEDVDYSELEYDFVLTSPPYYDIEKYTNEPTQSIVRYTSLEEWLDKFLFLTLTKIYKHLQEGGRIAINISDNSKQNVFICNDLLKHMESLGATYEGVIGYGLSHRPLPNGEKSTSSEPIFIWSKGEAKEPKWNQDNFFGV